MQSTLSEPIYRIFNFCQFASCGKISVHVNRIMQEVITILNRTKQFMRGNDLNYKKEYIRPMMTPQHVYVFRFGKHKLNNRVIIRYSHTWTGRLKINEIDVRLHHQHHPRIFRTENDLLLYLSQHMAKKQAKKEKKQAEEAAKANNK